MGDVYHVRTEQQPTGDGHRAFGASHVQRQRRSRDPSPDHLHRCSRRAGFAPVEAGGRADRAGSGTVREGRVPVVLPSCRGSVGRRNRRWTEARPPRHRAHARTGKLVRRVVRRGVVPEAGQGTPPVAVIDSYSPNRVEGSFCEVPLYGVLGSSGYSTPPVRSPDGPPTLGSGHGAQPSPIRCPSALVALLLAPYCPSRSGPPRAPRPRPRSPGP